MSVHGSNNEIKLFLLIVGAIVVIGVATWLGRMLADPKRRSTGIALLSAVLVLAGVVLLYFLRSVPSVYHVQEAHRIQWSETYSGDWQMQAVPMQHDPYVQTQVRTERFGLPWWMIIVALVALFGLYKKWGAKGLAFAAMAAIVAGLIIIPTMSHRAPQPPMATLTPVPPASIPNDGRPIEIKRSTPRVVISNSTRKLEVAAAAQAADKAADERTTEPADNLQSGSVESTVTEETAATASKSESAAEPANTEAKPKESAEKSSAKDSAESKSEPATEAAKTDPPKSSESRPAWVDAPVSYSNGVYEVTVASEPYSTIGECERALDSRMYGALFQYVASYIDPHPPALPYNAARIRQEFVTDRYVEQIQQSWGSMSQVHVRMRIDDYDRQSLERSVREMIANERVSKLAAVSAGVLGLLGIVYVGLRFAGRKRPHEEPNSSVTTAEGGVANRGGNMLLLVGIAGALSLLTILAWALN